MSPKLPTEIEGLLAIKTSLELHSRERQIVECEAYDRRGDPDLKAPIKMQGRVSHLDRHRIIVIIPSSNNPIHNFSLMDSGDGYGYEGNRGNPGGWRIRLNQLKTENLPEINDDRTA